MNKEAIEHRNRLKILENTMGTTFYETGHLHLAISDAMEEYHKAKLKLLYISIVSQQRELLLAYHKYLDSLNDPTVYNASESMIDDYLANNCG